MTRTLHLYRTLFAIACAVATTGCDAVGNSNSRAIELSEADIAGSASLSKSEQDGYIARCYAQRYALADYLRIRPTGGDVNEKLDVIFESFCDCYVNKFGSVGSKLQLKMTMSLIDKARVQLSRSSVPEFPEMRAAAAKVGMSNSDFDRARIEIADIADSIYIGCLSNWARSGAR